MIITDVENVPKVNMLLLIANYPVHMFYFRLLILVVLQVKGFFG